MADADVAAVVEASARAEFALIDRLVAALLLLWRRVDVWDGDAVSAVAARSVVAVAQGQAKVRALVARRQELILRLLGVPESQLPRGTGSTYPRAHTTIYDVWNRPARQVRYAATRGARGDELDSMLRLRVRTLATTDLVLAGRDEARRALDAVTAVKYYRRVIHPELSRTGSCGLCVVAADRVYKKNMLLPLHDGCHCTVMPILGQIGAEGDPGYRLNRADLDKLYAVAGSSFRDDLRRLRVREVPHGELGPILVQDGQEGDGSRRFVPFDEVTDSSGMWADVYSIGEERVKSAKSAEQVAAHRALMAAAESFG